MDANCWGRDRWTGRPLKIFENAVIIDPHQGRLAQSEERYVHIVEIFLLPLRNRAKSVLRRVFGTFRGFALRILRSQVK